MNNFKYASLNISVKAVDPALFQIRAVFSTPMVDRHGEVVDQKGWQLTEFMLNPVVLWSHDNFQPAIGKVVDLGFIDGNLEGTIQFAAKEYAFAETIYNLYAGGYVRAISVGFQNDEWKMDEVNDVVVLLKNTLFEVSCVNIPANALALAKSKGVDITALESRMQKTSAFNGRMMGKESGQQVEDEKVEDKKPVDPPTPASDEEKEIEKTEAEIQAAAPLPGDATVAPSVGDATKGLETLLKSDNGTIKAAVQALQSHLDAVKPSQHRSNVDGKNKGSANRQINRLVRHLLKAKD